MKVLIHIGGAQNGLNTAGSGEVRYALNLADMMAHHGHDVWCWGAGHHMHEPPQWGTQTPIPNIHFVMLKDVVGQKFDLVLNCPMEFQAPEGGMKTCTELPVESPIKVLTSFSWNNQVENGILKLFNGEFKKSFIIGTPYLFSRLSGQRIPHTWIPFPYFKEYAPLNINERNQITWACKDVYSDEWKIEKEMHFIGQKCMEVIVNIANEYDLTVNIVTANTNVRSDRAKRYYIDAMVGSIKNKNLVDTTVPMSEINTWLSRSRFSIILPGYAGSSFNSVASGCPTIFFESPDEFTQLLGRPVQLDRGLNVHKIQEFLKRFMKKQYFEQFITEQRRAVDPFSYDNAYRQLMTSLKDYI